MGKFIVIEGVDGVGKTTYSQILYDQYTADTLCKGLPLQTRQTEPCLCSLQECEAVSNTLCSLQECEAVSNGKTAIIIAFPSKLPNNNNKIDNWNYKYGIQARELIVQLGKLNEQDKDIKIKLIKRFHHLCYKDRLINIENIKILINKYDYVICDRYILSGLIYILMDNLTIGKLSNKIIVIDDNFNNGHLTYEEQIEFDDMLINVQQYIEMQKSFPVPDKEIILYCDNTELEKRIKNRNNINNEYDENLERLKIINLIYRDEEFIKKKLYRNIEYIPK